jgi:hypothetical protein
MVEVGLAEAGGLAHGSAEGGEQAAEALGGEGLLAGLPPAKGGPQLVVDPPVQGDGRAGAGEPEGREGRAQGVSLGPVEIEERVIDVEEDGAESAQEATWRGR